METPNKSELVVELLKESLVQSFGHALEDVVERCVSPLRTRARITRADFKEAEQTILAEAQERRRARSSQGVRSPKLRFPSDESGIVNTADWTRKPWTPSFQAPAQSVNGRSTPVGKFASTAMDVQNGQARTSRMEARDRLVSGSVRFGNLEGFEMPSRSATPRLDPNEGRVVCIDAGTVLPKSPDLNVSNQVWSPPVKQAFGPVTNKDHRQNDLEHEIRPFVNVLIKRSQFDVMNRMKPPHCRMLTPRGKFTRSNLHWQKQHCSLREGWG
eukprot:TRINITY_DN21632_c0_g1_i1.p1 TRINITY_DN21632_c0_g1~~TRINITY_DN21632_c0_g1_i1.p1  ORF type:complete len:271 (-),score=18.83 TRINITY_DN21632_c0_g1_i1:149-961(-)